MVFEEMAKTQDITLKMLVMSSFKVCKENAQAWQMAMQIDNKDMLMMRWRRHISAIMNEFAKQPSSNITQHALHDYVVDFMTGGVYMLLQRWMKEGMKTSAEEMGQLAYQLVAHFTNVSLPPTKYPSQN